MDKEKLKKEIEDSLEGNTGSKVARFALSVLSGIVPVAGGAIGGAASAWSEAEQEKLNNLLVTWLQLQKEEVQEIGRTLGEVIQRVDTTNEVVQKRIESPEYLKILKKCFRDWSAAESEEKRMLVRNLLANAASTAICSDDIIRLFVEWIDRYSELHFKVVRDIHQNPRTTRQETWVRLYGNTVRDDSGDADLFKLVVSDLSIGRIIRQHREKTYDGQYLKQPRTRTGGSPSRVMTSAFDDKDEYELTELGSWFVHYTMNETVARIEDTPTAHQGHSMTGSA